jgi:hypothetical protein
MTDDVNPENPDGVVMAEAPVAAPAKADFADHPLHAALTAEIEAIGGYATGRLHQLLEEMRALFNL